MNDPTDKALEAVAAIADYFTQVIEVASGHRRRAVEAGFSNEIAEQMGLVAHNTMMEVISNAGKAQP